MRSYLRTAAVITAFLTFVAATIALITEGLRFFREIPTPTPVIIPQPTPGDQLLLEDFEDGKADDFRFRNGTWQVVDDGTGNKVLEGNNLDYTDWPGVEFGPTTLGDYEVIYSVKLVEYDSSEGNGSGMAYLVFREGTQGSYNFAFVPYWHTLNLAYGPPNSIWQELEGGQSGEISYDVQRNVWYSVRIDVYGSQIKVYLDRNLVFNVDDTRLKDGRLVLATGPKTIVHFDNIRISK